MSRTDYAREYYHRTKEQRMPLIQAQRDKLAEQRKQWRTENRMKDAVSSIKSKCKKLGIPFDLTEEDLPIPEFCPVHQSLKLGWGLTKDQTPSVDRVDPRLGYIASNCRVISLRANRRKNDSTLEELRELVAYVERETMIDL